MTGLILPAHQPSSVGEILIEEFLEPMNISQTELAKAMCVGRKTVNELCTNRRRITAETAILLSKVFGTSPNFWLNLQMLNDLWKATHDEVFNEKLKNAQPFAA